MRNAIRVLIALVVLTVCSGSALVPISPLPTFTTAGAEGRPVLLWNVVSVDDHRLVVAVRSGTPAGVEITETQRTVTVLILGVPSTTLTTRGVHPTTAVVELPHALAGRQLNGPGQGQGGW